MGTQIEYSKAGLRLVCNVSTRPKPRPQQVYPMPDIPVGATTLLALQLVTITSTGRQGIQVTSIGAALPGGPAAVWTLLHAGYQGSMPSGLTWDEIPVQGTTVNFILDAAMPLATHLFALRRVDGGQATLFPQVSITTPDDPTATAIANIAADNMLSKGEKGGILLAYNVIVAEQAGLVAQAVSPVSPIAYNIAMANLQAYMAAVYPHNVGDGSLGALQGVGSGGTDWSNPATDSVIDGPTFRAAWMSYYNARTALRDAIAKATQGIAVGGLTSAANLVENGDSELGPIWGVNGCAANYVLDAGAGNAYGGTRYVRANNGAGSGVYGNSTAWLAGPKLVVPGDTIYASAMVCCKAAGTSGPQVLRVWFNNSAGSMVGSILSTAGPGQTVGQWVQTSLVTTVPAGASQVYMAMGDPGGTGYNYWLDNLILATTPPAAPATLTSLGAVKQGANILIAPDGTISATGGGGGGGTVTSVAVASANGFSGTVANMSTAAVITLNASASGVLKGAAGALVAATAGVDFLTPGAGQASDSAKLAGVAAALYLRTNAQASDSALLGGVNPSQYLLITAQAADSAKLGGQLPSAYQTTSVFLTNFSAMVNAPGVLTNNGSGGLSWVAPVSYQPHSSGLDSLAGVMSAGQGWIYSNGAGSAAISTPTAAQVGALAVGAQAADSAKLAGVAASGYALTILTGYVAQSAAPVLATDTLLVGLGRLQGQITANLAATVNFPGFGTTSTLACVGNDARLSDARPASDVSAWAKAGVRPTYTYLDVGSVANGDPRLSDSRPASDVSAWAKAGVKPSYTPAEVGALPASSTSVDSSKLGGQLPAYYQVALGFTPLAAAAQAVDSAKLGGQLPAYYQSALGFTAYNAANPSNFIALASTLTGYVVGANTALAAGDTLLAALGKVQGQITARVSFPGFGATGALACVGNDSRLSDARPAADVSAWAKAGTKPTYTQAEIGSGPVSGTTGNFTGTVASQSQREGKTTMGANNLDLSTGNVFSKTISGVTTLTVSNPPAAGLAIGVILDLTNGGSAAITWWGGIKWPGGATPALTAAGRDMLGFITHDGGATWTGLLLGKDIK